MVDVTVSTGTTIGMSATLPATYDLAGYAAVTFTNIGEVIDIGSIEVAKNIIKHQTVGRNYPQNIPDTKDISVIPLNIARVSADAGQSLLQTAFASDAHYSFQVVYPSGDTESFTGLVSKLGVGGAASGNLETTAVDITPNLESLFEA